MRSLFADPPGRVCILRLSAIGDTCHVLPVVRTLQQAWPQTHFTWIIGKQESKLLGHLPDIEFVAFDKKTGSAGYGALRRQLRGRRFDLLLHMQLALRASLIAFLVSARIKLGFDRARARELQWLFTNERILPAERQHVLDALFGFAQRLGVHERVLRWDIPLPRAALDYAARAIPDSRQRTLIVSPCSSHILRNWRPELYARVADHAAAVHGMRVLLCGGPSALEREMGEAIARHMRAPHENLIGKDSLLEFLATLARASLLLTPDSGPAHMATAVGTPVLGLYAATNPARSGPYLSRQWCVDRYDAAARKFLGRPASAIEWTTKIERPGVMDLITAADVIDKLDSIAAELDRQPVSRLRGDLTPTAETANGG